MSEKIVSGRPGRRSLEEGVLRRIEVRRLVRLKLRNHEIAKELNVSRTTVQADLRIIRSENKQWLQKVTGEGFISEFVTSLEYFQDLQRSLLTIHKDQSVPVADRIKAIGQNAEIEVYVMNLLAGFSSSVLRKGLLGAAEATVHMQLGIDREKSVPEFGR